MKPFFKSLIVRALTWEARMVLKKYKPKIVAITGSVGKTTTKDAIYFALASAFHVRRSEKSYNSEIGIPLTILGCQNAWYNPILWLKNVFKGFLMVVFPHKFPEWLVLEVGADRPGDIKSVSSWLSPDVVVFTNFAKVPVHVEFFPTPEALLKEKTHLIYALKDGGHLILNADDPQVYALKDIKRNERVSSYGMSEDADLKASHAEVMYEESNGCRKPAGINFKINYADNSVPVVLGGVLGKQHIYPVLAALSVGFSQGLNAVEMGEALDKYMPPRGRMNLVEGIKNSTIIDDTYNSSPIAVEEALVALKDLRCDGKKIAVLGDMMELGKHSSEAHQSIGKLIHGTVDVLLTVGVRAREIAEVALHNGMSEVNVYQFEEARQAGAFLQNVIGECDLILVKGSQSVRCERVVEEVMARPELKTMLLVRQEREWQVK